MSLSKLACGAHRQLWWCAHVRGSAAAVRRFSAHSSCGESDKQERQGFAALLSSVVYLRF